MKIKRIVRIALLVVVGLGWHGIAGAARLKDIVEINGVRMNQLVGYGLVVGLDGSGDGKKATFTVQSLASMLEKMGVTVDQKDIKVKNVAAVMVTAKLPPFAKRGNRIDVLVSSIGDANNLQGGTLMLTPLKGIDGKIYAVAQGPVSIGGFAAPYRKDNRSRDPIVLLDPGKGFGVFGPQCLTTIGQRV